jgi:hypothetical protein
MQYNFELSMALLLFKLRRSKISISPVRSLVLDTWNCMWAVVIDNIQWAFLLLRNVTLCTELQRVGLSQSVWMFW